MSLNEHYHRHDYNLIGRWRDLSLFFGGLVLFWMLVILLVNFWYIVLGVIIAILVALWLVKIDQPPRPRR